MTTTDAATHVPVLLLARDVASTRVVAAALRRRFGPIDIVLESAPGAWPQLKSRFARFGPWQTFGQLLFKGASPLLALPRRARRDELARHLEVEFPSVPMQATRVESVNSAEARALIRSAAPRVVVVNGTRILGRKTLASAAVFVNLHAGITPAYRGVHGGYWALVAGDSDNVGATVHRVDAGVDSGDILAQVRVHPTPSDGFHTLPLLQLLHGVPALVDVVAQLLEGRTPPPVAGVPDVSRQWYHPTLWRYVANGVARGVW